MFKASALVFIFGRCWFVGESSVNQVAANDAFSWRPALVQMPFEVFKAIKDWERG